MVDSASSEEPYTRYFGTLEKALEEAAKYEDRWQPFVWITEFQEGLAPLVHVRDGKLTLLMEEEYVLVRVIETRVVYDSDGNVIKEDVIRQKEFPELKASAMSWPKLVRRDA
jgi:hypothetical protein